jgi:hypothetical protein
MFYTLPNMGNCAEYIGIIYIFPGFHTLPSTYQFWLIKTYRIRAFGLLMKVKWPWLLGLDWFCCSHASKGEVEFLQILYISITYITYFLVSKKNWEVLSLYSETSCIWNIIGPYRHHRFQSLHESCTHFKHTIPCVLCLVTAYLLINVFKG